MWPFNRYYIRRIAELEKELAKEREGYRSLQSSYSWIADRFDSCDAENKELRAALATREFKVTIKHEH